MLQQIHVWVAMEVGSPGILIASEDEYVAKATAQAHEEEFKVDCVIGPGLVTLYTEDAK